MKLRDAQVTGSCNETMSKTKSAEQKRNDGNSTVYRKKKNHSYGEKVLRGLKSFRPEDEIRVHNDVVFLKN